MIKYSSANIKTWAMMGASGTVGMALFDIAKYNEKIFGSSISNDALISTLC